MRPRQNTSVRLRILPVAQAKNLRVKREQFGGYCSDRTYMMYDACRVCIDSITFKTTSQVSADVFCFKRTRWWWCFFVLCILSINVSTCLDCFERSWGILPMKTTPNTYGRCTACKSGVRVSYMWATLFCFGAWGCCGGSDQQRLILSVQTKKDSRLLLSRGK